MHVCMNHWPFVEGNGETFGLNLLERLFMQADPLFCFFAVKVKKLPSGQNRYKNIL